MRGVEAQAPRQSVWQSRLGRSGEAECVAEVPRQKRRGRGVEAEAWRHPCVLHPCMLKRVV